MRSDSIIWTKTNGLEHFTLSNTFGPFPIHARTNGSDGFDFLRNCQSPLYKFVFVYSGIEILHNILWNNTIYKNDETDFKKEKKMI